MTKDEIPDPHALAVACLHKDELITEDNTENLFYKVPDLLEFISRSMTLEPGDIVSMGTALKKSAQGGAVQNIDLNRLGGPVSITIDKIGTLGDMTVTDWHKYLGEQTVLGGRSVIEGRRTAKDFRINREWDIFQ